MRAPSFVPEPERASWTRGWAAGRPFAVAGFFLSASFGILAVDAGFPPWGALLFSLLVFGGSAQFASLAVFGAGGGLGAALVTAGFVSSRFLPMGVALAPSLPGGWLRRGLQGQPVVDSSWALAARGDGSYDRWFMFGCTAVQWVTFTSGTAFGAYAGDLFPSSSTLGLDALFPAFFLALLLNEVSTARARGVASAGALIAVAAVEVTPVGVPVLLACVAALYGLRASSSSAAPAPEARA